MNKIVIDAEVKLIHEIKSNIEQCILGKSDEITLLLTALLAGGHVLLEDVPGTGKTMLVKALSRTIQGDFRRIQCNPDLLPTDVTGVSIYHPKTESFIFRPGPVMTHILLVDEINRATTKTQSALLEAMEERQLTIDGEVITLPHPFLLIATQNPIEFEGTYSLPEAQLDRFMFKFSMGYPDSDTELRMIYSQGIEHPVENLKPVTDIQTISNLQQKIKEIYVEESVGRYIVELVQKTRNHRSIMLGASPRSTMSFIQAVKAYAFIQERNYVIPDDIKKLASYVLGHRLYLNSDALLNGESVDSVLTSIFHELKVPIR